jgi:hypothetical protein
MYVKFIAREDTWFDINTEVFDSTICDWGRTTKRMNINDYNDIWLKDGHILGRGLKNGFWDEELCPLEEFEVQYTEEQV